MIQKYIFVLSLPKNKGVITSLYILFHCTLYLPFVQYNQPSYIQAPSISFTLYLRGVVYSLSTLTMRPYIVLEITPWESVCIATLHGVEMERDIIGKSY